MAAHRIVCCEQTNCTTSGHIVAVGVGSDPSRASGRWTVHEVWNAIDRGEVFFTSDSAGRIALVRKYNCPCGKGSLKTAADASRENNLDNLRICHFPAA